MSEQTYLFPRKLTRRDFLWTAGAASAAAAGLSGRRDGGRADEPKKAVTLGEGKSTYTLDEDWGKLPAGMQYGFGCALVVDSQGPRLRHLALGQPVRRHLRQGRQAPRNVEQGIRPGGRLHAGAGSQPPPTASTGARKATTEYLYWTENVAAPQGLAEDRRPRLQDRPPGQSPLHDRQRGKGVVHVAEVRVHQPDRRGRGRQRRHLRRGRLRQPAAATASTRTSSTSRRSAAPARNTASSTPATASGSARSRRSRRSTSPTAPTTASRSIRWTWSTSGRCPTSACRAASTSTRASSTCRNWARG